MAIETRSTKTGVRYEFSSFELEAYRSLDAGWLESCHDVDTDGFAVEMEGDALLIVEEIERRAHELACANEARSFEEFWGAVFGRRTPECVVDEYQLDPCTRRELHTFVCESMTIAWREAGDGGRKPPSWEVHIWPAVDVLENVLDGRA